LEHELEPAVSPPVSAPAAHATAAPLTPLLGALSPARVIALQRTVGNRAVSALLQRDDTQKTPAAGPGDFGVSGGVPSGQGTSTASPAANNKVRALGPRVTLDGEAWLKEGKQLGTTAYFGVIQNLASSNRGAQYRHGGDPTGDIVAEPHSGEANKWDAAIDPTPGPKGEDQPQTFAPFYWKPGTIEDANDEKNPAKPTKLGTPWDQPEFSMPVQQGAGRLTAFKGQDVFKMGLAVKKDASVWMLTGNQWTVSWDIPVDASLNGAGKAMQNQQIKDLLKDGPDPSLKDWSLAPGAGSAFEGFSTQAEAMKRTPSELLNWVFAARQYDQVSYQNICAALDAKNPSFVIDIACATTDATFGSDVLSASFKKNGALVKSEGGIRLNNGESHTISASWSDVVGGAGGLTPGMAISVELYVGGESAMATDTFAFPFSGSKVLKPATGEYGVTLSLQ
jgi:hypothetical protein